jgi:hypothetical protein
VKRQQALGLESRVDPLQLDETVDHQAGPDEQDQRQGDLGNDQQPEQAMASRTAPGAAPAFFQSPAHVDLGGAQRGHDPEEQSGGDGNDEREPEQAHINALAGHEVHDHRRQHGLEELDTQDR